MYIIRRTGEKIGGKEVVWHGEKAERLSKGLLADDGTIQDAPMEAGELTKACNYTYTKDGKDIWAQEGDPKVLKQLPGGNVIGIHNITYAKDKRKETVLVVWRKQNGGFFPKWKIPYDKEVVEAIKSL